MFGCESSGSKEKKTSNWKNQKSEVVGVKRENHPQTTPTAFCFLTQSPPLLSVSFFTAKTREKNCTDTELKLLTLERRNPSGGFGFSQQRRHAREHPNTFLLCCLTSRQTAFSGLFYYYHYCFLSSASPFLLFLLLLLVSPLCSCRYFLWWIGFSISWGLES